MAWKDRLRKPVLFGTAASVITGGWSLIGGNEPAESLTIAAAMPCQLNQVRRAGRG